MGKNSAPKGKISATEQRLEIRNYIQNERDTILRKWQCLQESLKSEERIKKDFMRKTEIEKTRAVPIVVQKFIRTLKRSIRKTQTHKGGTPYSIIRSMFLYWDADKSGELSQSELQACMNSLGVSIPAGDIAEVIKYYDSGKGLNEMAYAQLLSDISHDEPSFIENVVNPKGSASKCRDAEQEFIIHDDSFLAMPPLVEDFIEAVRSVLRRKMVVEGGTELSHLRHSFLMFDFDYSNALSKDELIKAMYKNMNLVITPEQAQAVVNYYDRTNTGEMSYFLLLQDVLKGQPMLLQVNIDTVRTVKRRDERLKTNPFIKKEFVIRPNKRVETLKQNIRRSLDHKIRYHGGSVKSWLSKVFVAWDPHFTGYLTRWVDLQGAIAKLGINITEEDAKKVMQTYDVHSNGHLDYNLFSSDILKSDPSFMADSTSINDLKATATGRTPADISAIIRKFRRAAEVFSQKSDNSIDAGDLLHGTFMRFDPKQSGRLALPQFKQVCKEVKVSLDDTNAQKFLNWFDSDGSGRIDYAALTKQLFGDDVLCRPLSLPTIPKSNAHLDDPTQVKESITQKDAKKALRKKLIIAEKVRVQAKLESIEKQRQAILDNRKATK
jgi:Ca2+-binding EF-hand superfamily protein